MVPNYLQLQDRMITLQNLVKTLEAKTVDKVAPEPEPVISPGRVMPIIPVLSIPMNDQRSYSDVDTDSETDTQRTLSARNVKKE